TGEVIVLGRWDGQEAAGRATGWALRLQRGLRLDGADLPEVVGFEGRLLPGLDAVWVDVRAVHPVRALARELPAGRRDDGVMAGRPDAVLRLLVAEVDVDRPVVAAADQIRSVAERILGVDLEPADDPQPRRQDARRGHRVGVRGRAGAVVRRPGGDRL